MEGGEVRFFCCFYWFRKT